MSEIIETPGTKPDNIPQGVWDVAARTLAEMRTVRVEDPKDWVVGDVEAIARAIMDVSSAHRAWDQWLGIARPKGLTGATSMTLLDDYKALYRFATTICNEIPGIGEWEALTEARNVIKRETTSHIDGSATGLPEGPGSIPGVVASHPHQPELLDALKHAVHWHDQLTPADIARYEAVIAKAEGSQP